jgi:hypothetical protein
MLSVPEPLHTRLLTLRLAAAGADAFTAEARVLDVRKRGVVGLAGHLHGPGVVHDMQVQLTIGRADLCVREARLAMLAVPFPAGPFTNGEGCRDNEEQFASLVGVRLGTRSTAALHRAIGGRRGCFHVFTLMRLVAPSLESLAAGMDGLADDGVLSRSIVVDGVRAPDGLALCGTVTDVRSSGGELGGTFEARAVIEVGVPGLIVRRLSADHRSGGTSGGGWSSDGLPPAGVLDGASLVRGFGLDVLRHFPAGAPLAPVRDLLLMLQPVAFQCMPALGDEAAGARPARPKNPVAATDSCRMWRADGPLVARVRS